MSLRSQMVFLSLAVLVLVAFTLVPASAQLSAANFNGDSALERDKEGNYVVKKVASPYCKVWFNGCEDCTREVEKGVVTCPSSDCPEENNKNAICKEYFDSEEARLHRKYYERGPDGKLLNPDARPDYIGHGVMYSRAVPVNTMMNSKSGGGSSVLPDGVNMCEDSPRQLCRRLCVEYPTCAQEECVYRVGACCEFICKNKSEVDVSKLSPDGLLIKDKKDKSVSKEGGSKLFSMPVMAIALAFFIGVVVVKFVMKRSKQSYGSRSQYQQVGGHF